MIEKRLECVVVLPVDDGDVDGEVAERFGCMKASESCANDDNARASIFSGHFKGLRQFAHSTSLSSVWMPERALLVAILKPLRLAS